MHIIIVMVVPEICKDRLTVKLEFKEVVSYQQ
jgi:hypothetical protein